ncbi:YcdB/YcdC domain-containing protein [Saccharibacillus sp. O23]|uniref:YcdB/YcdC domain-containing protein n=1 Tax=Saccharibacillus sp. O23 TaxID=2009338 RepID=UPI0015C59FC4|nr:YcdB/YcdC domain-containing protein [Saccharibacillus sp. O23]
MKRIKASIPASRRAAAAVLATVVLCSPALANQASAAPAENGESVEFSTSALTGSIPEGAKVSSSAAAAAVQKLFPELKPSDVSSADYSAYYGTGDANQTWRLTYALPGQNGNSASVGVDAVKGNVVDAYVPSDNQADAKLTREQASERAMQFLLRAMPNNKSTDFVQDDTTYSDGSSVSPLLGGASYTFSYRMKVNGVPSQPETAVVSLDRSGAVSSYSRSVNNLTYPSASPKVSAEAARKIYESGFDVKLTYIPNDEQTGASSTYYLGYVPFDSAAEPIDAVSGERLDSITGLPYPQSVAIGQDGEALQAGGFVSAPLKTENAAQEQLKKLGLFPEGYKVNGQQTYTQDYPKKNTKVWVIDLAQVAKGRTSSVNVQLNAETGQIYNYYFYDSEASSGASVQPTAKNKEQAIAWASKLLPNAQQWRLISTPKKGDWSLAYSFQRYESGIAVQGDTASVTIGANGQLNEFYAVQPSISATGTFPAASSVKVAPAEAKAKFLKDSELQLYYSQFSRYATDPTEQSQTEIKLTYVPMLGTNEPLGAFNALDASDGQWKTTYGSDDPGKPSAGASDIAGHAEQSALEAMIDHGILVPDDKGKVDPDAKLTRGEWADMLARALQPNYSAYNDYPGTDLFRDVNADSPYQSAIGALAGQGWLTPDKTADFRPNAELNRDDLAHLLMGVLNYDKLASYYNSTVDLPGIADAAGVTNKGDAALAIKLGLLPAVNGNFLPRQVVTKADASAVLMRLADLQGKTDTFMNWNSW